VVRQERATFPLLVGVELYSQPSAFTERFYYLFSLHSGYATCGLDPGYEILPVLSRRAGAALSIHPQNIQL
jgi:hypothetical protein